ncbi:MAG: ABC transporter ATP-binding protein [Polyangiales bacterium]
MSLVSEEAEGSELLKLRGLKTAFHTDEGITHAVKGVDLTLKRGQTLGLVGESGSGKSVTSLSVMGLLPPRIARVSADAMLFGERELGGMSEKQMQSVRGNEIAMIFQEPGTSLNPVYRVGAQITEAILQHEDVTKAEARARALTLFQEVGIPDPERRLESYPHEMSGGQKQRVMIAMALSCNPELLIADEPTTALDVTIQAQILALFRRLRDERDMAILFITHDLGVIAEIADEVAVMYRGDLVEHSDVRSIFENPKHPYTKGLLACRPRLETSWRRLPTVSDFMEVEGEGDDAKLIEKVFDHATADERFGQGRGRLLHPASELAEMGHEPPDASATDEKNAWMKDAALVPEGAEPMLEVRDLKVHFPIRGGLFARVKDWVRAVDGVSLRIYPGQTLGLVGESGCGKTTLGRALLRLQDATAGDIVFRGQDVLGLRRRELRDWRRHVQIVFQDPYGSLNPRMTVEAALTEAMSIHGIGADKDERRQRAAKLLDEVGLKEEHLTRYPHEFSGGQRQRIGIARALAVEPQLIVCDESVSALDVSVQAQVLNLLKDLQEARGLTYLFISHDLSVVKFMADMMLVMNEGKVVEAGPSDAIYLDPKEDYTRALIDAIPNDSLANIDARRQAREAAKN